MQNNLLANLVIKEKPWLIIDNLFSTNGADRSSFKRADVLSRFTIGLVLEEGSYAVTALIY